MGWATDTVRTLLGDEAGLEEETLVLVVGEVTTVGRHNTPEVRTSSIKSFSRKQINHQ